MFTYCNGIFNILCLPIKDYIINKYEILNRLFYYDDNKTEMYDKYNIV